MVENGNGSSPPLVLPNEMNAGAGSLINLLRGPTWQREKEQRVLEETRKLVAGRIPVVYEMCIFFRNG